MEFRPSDSREKFPVHKCPILLAMLCFLVKQNAIDLSDTSITMGDLYFQMVHCLYKKYTIGKGVPFDESELIEVMKRVGQLALRTLLSKTPLLQKSEIIEIAGDFVLDYGFFGVEKNFTCLTADTYVNYAHRSLEEFFGSFGFLQALNDGKSVEDILGSDYEKQIFLVNPLVFTFCLWLSKKCFGGSQGIVYDKLVSYAAQQIDVHVMNMQIIAEMYPAINIKKALENRNSLKLGFFKDVFKKCKQVRDLRVSSEYRRTTSDEVESLLALISDSLVSNLKVLSLENSCVNFYELLDAKSNDFTIAIKASNLEFYNALKILLRNSNILKRNPQVCAEINCDQSCNLSTLIQKHVKKLHLRRNANANIHKVSLSASSEFPYCPQFTHFTAEHCIIDDSVPSAFMKAVTDGKFPNLRRIELINCVLNDCEWPEVPEFYCDFQSKTMPDSSQVQKLFSNLTEVKFFGEHNTDCLVPFRLEKLSVLRLYRSNVRILNCLNDVLKQEFLPNLSQLSVDVGRWRTSLEVKTFLRKLDPNSISKLEKLEMRCLTISADDLKILSEKLTSLQLTELDMLSHGFTGNLTVLFTHGLPTLTTLTLIDCRLNSDDVQSLAKAEAEDKLPQLKYLEISQYFEVYHVDDVVDIAHLFTHSAQWNRLTTLETCDENILNVEPGFLTSLEKLIVMCPRGKKTQLQSVTRRWPRLKVIKVWHDEHVRCIVDGVERGMFPSLTTVRADEDLPISFQFKLFRANISIERF